MAAHTFSPLVRFYWQDQAFIVRRHLADQQVVIEALTTGVIRTVLRAELEQALFDGQLWFEIQGVQSRSDPNQTLATQYTFLSLDDCSEQQQAVARLRFAVIEPLLQLPSRERTHERIQARIEEVQTTFSAQALTQLGCRQISRASIYRWLKQYSEGEAGLRGLIPQTQKCGAPGQSRLHPQVDQLLHAYFEEVVGVRTRWNRAAMYDEVCLRIQELNATRETQEELPYPSQASLNRRYRIFRQRADSLKARTQYGVFEAPLQPLERVEIDHTRSDLFVVDDMDHLPLGRLTLTLCIDVKTRYPLGYYLGFSYAGYEQISECLYHAIQPKKTREQFDTQHDWLAYGIPQTLVTDHGRDFIGKELVEACQMLGIQLIHTPQQSPHLKPFIERLFSTFNTGFFHTAPGTTFSNIVDRANYNSEKSACVYLSQIDQALNLFVTDIYAQTHHSGLHDTPAHHWKQAIEQGFVPRLPANSHELHVLLGQTLKRKLQRNGITIHGLMYSSPALRLLRLKLKDQPVKIKYHANDLSVIYVYDPFDQIYLTIPALDQEYTQELPLWKHQFILQRAKQTAGPVDRMALVQARRALQMLFAQGFQRRRRAQQKRRNPGRPPATRPMLPSADLQSLLEENEQQAQKRWEQVRPPRDNYREETLEEPPNDP